MRRLRRAAPHIMDLTRRRCLEQHPASLDIRHHSLNAILNLRHRHNNRHHIACRAGIESLIRTYSCSLRHKANIPLGEVLRGRSIAVYHLANGTQGVSSAIAIEQHKHRTIAIRYALELLKLRIRAWRNLTHVSRFRATDISRVIVFKSSTHPSPPSLRGASPIGSSTQRAERD